MKDIFANNLFRILVLVICLGVLYSLLGNRLINTTPPESNKTSTATTPGQTKNTIACSGEPTAEQTEGPYYKAGSPEIKDIAQGVSGEKLVVRGFVYDTDCKPIANAWLDFWQADSTGVYDNDGYKLRGHQYSDENGRYELQTIVPLDYESRPPHIHVKVRSGNGPILTSQLYFPGASQNEIDGIFNQELLMDVQESSGGKTGTFNFFLNQ